MITNVVGTNYVGKTTLIERVLSDDFIFLDIRKYREIIAPQFYKKHPNRIGPLALQFKILRNHLPALEALIWVFFLDGWFMAERFWRHFFIHACMIEKTQLHNPLNKHIVMDEGLIKKLYESVEAVGDAEFEQEKKKWIRFNRRLIPYVLKSLRGLVDQIVLITAKEEVFLKRAALRDPFFSENVGKEKLLNRYKIQLALYDDILQQAANQKLGVYTVDSTDSENGIKTISDIFRRSSVLA